MEKKFTKWVSCWGNATSITDRKEAVYAKDITLRYPIKMAFDGSKLRFRFSNLTGTEPVTITKAFVADEKISFSTPISFSGNSSVEILPGKEGLVHISKLAWERVEKVEDVVKEGDIVKVKLVEIDNQGRLNLSIRDTLPKPEGYVEEEPRRRENRNNRDRGDRRNFNRNRGERKFDNNQDNDDSEQKKGRRTEF